MIRSQKTCLHPTPHAFEAEEVGRWIPHALVTTSL